MRSLSRNWEFTSEWSEAFLGGEGEAVRVDLPHNFKELPLHYSSPADYEAILGYRKTVFLPAEDEGKRLFLRFDGAAHIATVYWNGEELGTHKTGYTGVSFEVTDRAVFGDGKQLDSAVRVCHRLPDLQRALPRGLARRPE